MRLTKRQAEIATQELLEILRHNPQGKSTSDLSGTPKFHGGRTLSNRQIIRLLRKTGQVSESVDGHGMYTRSWWRLNKKATATQVLEGAAA
jgi:hypothetical protein